jgi:hypothetical protein
VRVLSYADQTYFTREALEQATSELMARHRARRYRSAQEPIYDLCCSIGGDLLALADASSSMIGLDLEEIAAVLASDWVLMYFE